MRAALAPRVAAPASTSAPTPVRPRGDARVRAARSPWTAARRLASSETRLSVASPRGVRPRPHAVASPPSSGIARRTSGRDVASRASSLAGWTHGFGDADSGPVDGAAMPPSPSPTRLGFSRLVALCAASFAAALLAQHVFTWPGLAAVAPAAAFATGNLGVATNAFPAVIVSALTKTAALVASAASQTVSLAAAVAAGAASGAAGYAAAAEAAAAEMAALRAELAELRVAVADAAAAAKRETTHGTRGGAASSASLDEVSGDASTRRQAFLFDAPGVASAVASENAVDSGPARLSANVDFENGTERHVPTCPTSPTERTNPDGKDGKEASPSDLVSTKRARAEADAEKTKKALKELFALRLELQALRAYESSRRSSGVAPTEGVDWNARARANAVWAPAPPSRAPPDVSASVKSERQVFSAETKAAETRRALAAARADLRALRAARRGGDSSPPGSLEARVPPASVPTDYAAIAKARALWSPGAPGDAPGGGGGGATRGVMSDTSRGVFPGGASHATTGASDGAAETARLEAEDREWRRRIRMDAGSEDPFEDAR